MIDINKLNLLTEVFNNYKTNGIKGVWTDGRIEIVIFADIKDYESIGLLRDKIIELFGIDNLRVSGGTFETRFIDRFKKLDKGYFVN